MGRTLFWYIFKDLLRIFLLTSGALSGIMSFAGLLKPLTQNGLDLRQVGEILGYFLPAMTTYSLPIAALFATTLVYGRLGADNETVACRAAGISHLALSLPAFVLGVGVALLSLLLLCFVVPALMLKAERVVFSNVARIVATAIDRNHQVQLESGSEKVTVFAREARVLPADPQRPGDQAVQLISPTIVTFEPQPVGEARVRVPRDFWMAERATAYITAADDSDELMLTAQLEGGTKFPRSAGGTQGGVGLTDFGPLPIPSLVRENTQFMNITRLLQLLREPGESRRVRQVLREFIRAEQRSMFFEMVRKELDGGECIFDTVRTGSELADAYTLVAPVELVKVDPGRSLSAHSPRGERKIRLIHERAGRATTRIEAADLRLTVVPDASRKMIYVTIELRDAIVQVGNDQPTPRAAFSRSFVIEMREPLLELERRDAEFYLSDSAGVVRLLPEQQRTLRRQMTVLSNGILTETHARASFSLSCLILVMVGCALGMMFRSGNFLSAFAVSVVPALICIALIVTGQQTGENVPRDFTGDKNPINIGLMLIWSGNVAVMAMAVALLARLQRQ